MKTNARQNWSQVSPFVKSTTRDAFSCCCCCVCVKKWEELNYNESRCILIGYNFPVWRNQRHSIEKDRRISAIIFIKANFDLSKISLNHFQSSVNDFTLKPHFIQTRILLSLFFGKNQIILRNSANMIVIKEERAHATNWIQQKLNLLLARSFFLSLTLYAFVQWKCSYLLKCSAPLFANNSTAKLAKRNKLNIINSHSIFVWYARMHTFYCY